jgi:hypothetical protein
MAELAQLDPKTKGRESQIRALLGDTAAWHMGAARPDRLALAVWVQKSPESDEHVLLELFTGFPVDGFAAAHFSLLWNSGSEGPPYVTVRTASVGYFSRMLSTHPAEVAAYHDRFEVIYYDKGLLTEKLIETFQIVTDPPGLIRGWYVSAQEYEQSHSVQGLVSRHSARPELALVKTEESASFENCRGILHVEKGQKWLPLSPDEIRSYTYFTELQGGRSVYLLFEGGAVYQVLKYEVKTLPDLAGRLLGRTSDDRYPEVYLRAVYPSTPPTA